MCCGTCRMWYCAVRTSHPVCIMRTPPTMAQGLLDENTLISDLPWHGIFQSPKEEAVV